MATLVKFLKSSNSEITAIFPQLNYNKYLYGNNIKTCYAHVGQHSCASKEWIKEQATATKIESVNLLEELISIGYELKVLNK